MVWNIAYFAAAVAAGAGNGVPAGLFIPIADLPGISPATELTGANNEKKVAFSISNALFTALDADTAKLGLAVTKPSPTGAGTDRLNQAFTYAVTHMVNHAANSVGMVPAPGTGVGNVTVSDVFPTASLVAAEAALPGAGVVIPNAVITAAGGLIPADVGAADARSWFSGLYQSMIQNLEPSTALVTATRSSATGLTPPANFTGTNAITGINAADLPLRSFFTITYTLTLQLALDQSAQTFDVAA